MCTYLLELREAEFKPTLKLVDVILKSYIKLEFEKLRMVPQIGKTVNSAKTNLG